jgi:carbonic anhydrase
MAEQAHNNSRRNFLRLSGLGFLAAVLPEKLLARSHRLSERPDKPSAEQAVELLKAGNMRFQTGVLQHPNETMMRRKDVAHQQMPFATILACADSRESPELLFDQGLGDLFVVRTAGHVLDSAVLGSIEFGISELKIPLLVVLGHQRCGAVKASIEAVEVRMLVPGSIEAIVDGIRPALLLAEGEGSAFVDNAVRANVRVTVQRLGNSKIISTAVAEGRVKIVGAYYSLDTGEVVFFLPN